ncbi:glycosyltransferase family 2 protein [uncultured Enterococcus sp.]|uniref:glycosyltransferase family 2 protein n=1 Tax=uncultured Enterococcus sp. TaxID=167972 RepID=UPI0025845714|nr:glycosyltransferase family 2 protein [uncultured Enterococcus sp.]
MDKIAVLIPCYNEEQTIQAVIDDFRAELPEGTIYVYDNNSTDNTYAIAKAAGVKVKKESRQGKGNVVRTMFREIDALCYLLVDGDDTYPAKDARKMCREVLENDADMVTGDRLSSTYFSENKRPFHKSGNVMVHRLINSFFNGNIKDILTGYRALSPLVAKIMPVLSKGFEIETEMNIHALDKNFVIKTVEVDYRDRLAGSESKLNTVSDGVRVIKTIVQLFKDYRPLLFFSTLAALLAVGAIGLGTPVFIDYFRTGFVERMSTLITAGFLMLAALLKLSCGFILDTENKKARQNFELQLNVLHQLLTKKEETND